jgi:hypothetical protein
VVITHGVCYFSLIDFIHNGEHIMASKAELALDLKGIAYDAHNARESYLKGGPLEMADVHFLNDNLNT